MKILLANSRAYPTVGGVENSLRFMARELLAAGHQVKIYCLETDPAVPLRMEYEGVEIVRTPYRPERWPHRQIARTVAAVAQGSPAILDEFQPEAIWSRSTLVGMGIREGGYRGPLLQIFPTCAKMYAKGLFLQTQGLPLRRRMTLLGLWPFGYFSFARLERRLARQCRAIAFSQNMRRQLLAAFPRDARECRVIAPGVDANLFSPENGSSCYPAIIREFGLRPEEPIVLYVGRIANDKKLPMLMDAVATLPQSVKLVLVGDGPERERLTAYAQRIGLAERLVFTGIQRDKLPGFYAIARVTVLPTTIESFGQVYLESLASGTPAVGFAGDGRRVLTATSEILRDGETGGVAGQVSAAALAEKIEKILSLDEKAYAAMSQRGRQEVLARFSWRRFTEEALALSLTPSSAGSRM